MNNHKPFILPPLAWLDSVGSLLLLPFLLVCLILLVFTPTLNMFNPWLSFAGWLEAC